MAYVNNASALAYEFVLGKIKSGEWAPGDRIWTESQLCQRLGVSRVAVRQALDRLAAQSLLRKIQGSGTYVTEPPREIPAPTLIEEGEEDILDILEFRRYFEVGNIQLFIKNGTADHIRELERDYETMQTAAAAGDMVTFYQADYHYHNVIALGTGKKFIYHIATTLNQELCTHQAELNARIGPAVGLEYHGDILEYIKRKDADLAAMFMQRHIEAAIRAVKKAQESLRLLKEKKVNHEPSVAARNS
ncbi:MAG: FCD domain-containing protein [Planctomycetes bacterium]|nr:FCD domain-containing protein [Planctomycetota bacterium]